jgi:N-acetylneuraminic acid mutarotase
MDFTAIMSQTDSILESQGLYQDVSYTDVSESIENYDPITGKYSNSTTNTYTFKAVVLSQDNKGEEGHEYGVGISLIVIPSRLEFKLRANQVFVIDGSSWQVGSFDLAPQDTIYQISLRRK